VEILNDWFDKRKQYKDLMKKAYKSGDKAMGEYYNRLQHTFKIKLNDVYGVFAQNGWRYSDGNLFISKAITLTGQRLDQESINFVNSEVTKELGVEKDYVITADTDSLFFELKDLIIKRKPDVDINNKWELTINKINTFIQNHEAKVINVKRWGRQMDYVYNLEVEDNHNYIANDVLVSNCHLLGMEGRGDHLESAMMRFSAINPKCKIIALSATMPNVKEIASWLTLLNGKKSLLIKSEWRPVQLDIHYETY
jgi:DNA polymerase elongation subunit (family B)